ncbi:MAG: phosphatase PAP2 family protein [bacterium]|nr:phosphatase PAP2 family protein [bacterium]
MRTFFKKLSIIDYLYLSTLAVVAIFYILAYQETPYKIATPVVLLALLTFLVVMIVLRSKNTFKRRQPILSVLYPMVFILGLFETFFMILSYFNPNRYDELMARIDYLIFGLNPTVWIEGWISPVLTEFFYLVYVFYFFMPFFIIFWMYRKKKFKELAESIFFFSVTYFGAYVIYFLVPVQGPRYFLKDLQTVPLEGLLFTEPIRKLIDFAEPNKLDAFPSLHTAIVLVVLTLCYKHHKKMFYAFLPISIGIFVSLVYCRYHYFIDMLAGLAWFILAYYIGFGLYGKYASKCYPHFGEVEK